MINLYSIDSPFILFEMLLQVFFAFITLLISYLALKVYNVTKRKSAKYILIGFLFMAFSYLVQAIFSFLKLLEYDYELYLLFGIHPLAIFQNQSIYLHIFFMTIGFSFILLTTFKNVSKKLLLIILLPTLLTLLHSRFLLQSFFVITSVYLAFMVHHYFLNYVERKNVHPLLITFAFLLLFLGQVEFVFMGTSLLIYLIANIFNFLAFILILINFYLIVKR